MPKTLPLSPNLPPERAEVLHTLTDREKQVTGLLMTGLTNRQIAARLGLTESTVKVYLRTVFEKLGVGTRTAAVAYCLGGEVAQ